MAEPTPRVAPSCSFLGASLWVSPESLCIRAALSGSWKTTAAAKTYGDLTITDAFSTVEPGPAPLGPPAVTSDSPLGTSGEQSRGQRTSLQGASPKCIFHGFVIVLFSIKLISV